MSKPDFSNFLKNIENDKKDENESKQKIDHSDTDVISYTYPQCKLIKQDAKRFKRAAEDRGLSIHTALVEGINKLMAEWGEPPVTLVAGGAKKNTIIL